MSVTLLITVVFDNTYCHFQVSYIMTNSQHEMFNDHIILQVDNTCNSILSYPLHAIPYSTKF